MKDPYEILGVPPGAGSGELKKAFRRLARQRHPDSDPGNPWAEDDFKDLSAAYDLLTDPKRRARFDRGEITGDWTRGRRPRRPKSPPSRPQGTAKRPKPKKPARPKAAKRSKTAGLKIKGVDVEYTLHVEFLEAARGGQGEQTTIFKNLQNLGASVSDSLIDADRVTTGAVSIREHALDNFSGVGLFNFVTGNNNAVDVAISITINLQ